MARAFWIASYPKSGNTWVRFILADLLAGPVTSAAEVARLIPDTHQEAPPDLRPLYRGSVVLKTHRLPSRLGVARGRDAGVLYVVRNPLDVFCSLTDYRCIAKDERAVWLDRFVADQGAADLATKGIGTLPENVAAWTTAPIPCLVVRYEDLSAAPIKVVGDIARRLRLPVTAQGIAATLERCSFSAMRAMEEAEIAASSQVVFGKRAHSDSWRFMNRGRVGAYRELLSDGEIDRLADAFAPVMASLGYGLDAQRRLTVGEANA